MKIKNGNLMLSPHLKNNSNFTKWIIHLRQQAVRKRMAIICGAGISADAGIPTWEKLVNIIAEKIEDIPDSSINFFENNSSPAFLTQVAYDRHMKSMRRKSDSKNLIAKEQWSRIVHGCLYSDCKDSIKDIIRDHPYLQCLAKLAYKCPLIVTFNFDSLLADAMQLHASTVENETGERLILPDVTTHPGIVEKPGATTIFHINGQLPRNLKRKRSEKLVFTENALADAMMSTNTLEYNHLLISLSNYTNLIIGHSLNDASLKALLRGTRNRTPSQIHYYFYWIREKDSLEKIIMEDIFNTNLEVYNLITIFVTTSDIKVILNLITIKDEVEFQVTIQRMGAQRHRFNYFIVGPVASGKTSVLHHLRYFQTYEEWLDPVPPEMYLNHNSLTTDQRVEIDEWVAIQLQKKNSHMSDNISGFYFMDRAPLDALVFSVDKEERRDKAVKLYSKFKNGTSLSSGQIVFLSASGDILQERNIRRGRLPKEGGSAKYLSKQSKDLFSLYSPEVEHDTKDKIPGEVAREIAISVLLEKYCEKNLGDILSREINET